MASWNHKYYYRLFDMVQYHGLVKKKKEEKLPKTIKQPLKDTQIN